jgi:hypothetical protein
MRTKALFLTAAACVVSAATMAQVVSVNVVGFINKECAAGSWTLIANQLNGTNNYISTIVPSVPVLTEAWVWDGPSQQFNELIMTASGWFDVGLSDFNPTFPVPPGTALFIHNVATTNFTITLVGEVPQNPSAPLTQTIYPGFTLLGSIPPVSTSLADTAVYNFPVSRLMSVLFWDLPESPGGWTTFTYTGTAWFDVVASDFIDPVPPVGAGFWVDATAVSPPLPAGGIPWNMTFTVH